MLQASGCLYSGTPSACTLVWDAFRQSTETAAYALTAKLLRRSTCRPRFESTATPKAASVQCRARSQFKRRGERPATKVFSTHGMGRRYERGFYGCRDRRFKGLRTQFRGFRHSDIIQNGRLVIQYLITCRASISEQEHVLAFAGSRNYAHQRSVTLPHL
jgi:hypothetical protein